ncbi:MAG TPA: S-layer homology domain-containing protein [Oscillospiraceae bacterium]|nr:S-layer homology domain-containing protein [Oscillospiraceae bacterium]
MKKKTIKNIIVVGILFSIVTMSVFAEVEGPGDLEDKKIIPIIHTEFHWADEYVQKVINTYGVESIFEDRDLNDILSAKEFQNLISLTIDEDYTNILESMTREEVVNELVYTWANKTGNKVEEIPTIKMIVYADMEEIKPEYNHSITVAYMKNIANGKGFGMFVPKTEVTYGEAAAMIIKLETAIEKEIGRKESEKTEKTLYPKSPKTL